MGSTRRGGTGNPLRFIKGLPEPVQTLLRLWIFVSLAAMLLQVFRRGSQTSALMLTLAAAVAAAVGLVLATDARGAATGFADQLARQRGPDPDPTRPVPTVRTMRGVGVFFLLVGLAVTVGGLLTL